MNKERREVASILSELCAAFSNSKVATPRVVFAMHHAVERLQDSEARSIRSMEPHKTSETTARNYRIAIRSHDALTEAMHSLKEGDMASAAEPLLYVAEGCPDSDKPVAKRKRSRQ